MTKSIAKLFVLLSAFTFAAPRTMTAPLYHLSAHADMIKGQVVTATGEPLKGARVSLMRTGAADPVLTVRSDADGTYELTIPPTPGVYSVRVISIGYTPEVITLTNTNGQWSGPAQVTMHPIPVGL